MKSASPRRGRSADLPVGLFGETCVQPRLQKYSCSLLTQISSLIRAVLSQERGVAHVINPGWDAVDAGGTLDESCCCGRRSRVVLTPRRRRQVCEKKCRRRGQTSPIAGESAKEAVKPLRR